MVFIFFLFFKISLITYIHVCILYIFKKLNRKEVNWVPSEIPSGTTLRFTFPSVPGFTALRQASDPMWYFPHLCGKDSN